MFLRVVPYFDEPVGSSQNTNNEQRIRYIYSTSAGDAKTEGGIGIFGLAVLVLVAVCVFFVF